MSNTRLTDIDVLERRAPVVIRRFSIRRDSGGDGEARGGDGLVRCYEFRTPVSLSVFASRRRTPPRGAEGGLDGQVGRQTIQRDRDSRPEEHPQGVFAAELGPGGQLTIETPGAGGWGAPPVVPPVVPPVRPTA
jgi:5-oxoprolinase (ATP-hydrolysing)